MLGFMMNQRPKLRLREIALILIIGGALLTITGCSVTWESPCVDDTPGQERCLR